MSLLIVTCGPSGVGKTTQMQRLIARDRRRFSSVLSVTTRQRRNAEDGEWYRFVTRESTEEFDSVDVISNVTYRGEKYLLLKSEIAKALSAAPIAFLSLVPDTVMLLRELRIPHALIRCKVGDWAGFENHLRKRGYEGEVFDACKTEASSFAYPLDEPSWSCEDVMLGSDAEDDAVFVAAVRRLAGNLFPQSLE